MLFSVHHLKREISVYIPVLLIVGYVSFDLHDMLSMRLLCFKVTFFSFVISKSFVEDNSILSKHPVSYQTFTHWFLSSW